MEHNLIVQNIDQYLYM